MSADKITKPWIPRRPKKLKGNDIVDSRQLRKIQFSAEEIQDTLYKGDMELLDRYLKFTEEVLRLSLLSITGVVSFISLVYRKDGGFDMGAVPYKSLYFSSLVCFCLAAAAALFHRFQSVDGFACHIKYLRDYKQFVKSSEQDDARETVNECLERNYRYEIGGKGLVVASILLSLGIIAFAGAIAMSLLCGCKA